MALGDYLVNDFVLTEGRYPGTGRHRSGPTWNLQQRAMSSGDSAQRSECGRVGMGHPPDPRLRWILSPEELGRPRIDVTYASAVWCAMHCRRR